LPWFLSNIDSQFHLQQKALDVAMNDINNSFGKGSVTRLGSAGGAFVYVSSFLIPFT
jgi:recombination protein RecA